MDILKLLEVPVKMGNRFIGWWFGELLGMVPAGLRRAFARGRRMVAVHPVAGGFRIYRWDGTKSRSLGEALPAAEVATIVAASRKTAEIVFCLPGERALVKEITLPPLPEDELRRALFYQIDRQTPFAAGDVHFDYALTESSPARIRAALTVVPRKLIEQELRPFTDLRVGFDRIAITDAGSPSLPRLSLAAGFEESAKGRGPAGMLNAVMAATACVLVAATAYLAVHDRQAAADGLSARVAGARRAADEVAAIEKEVGALRKDLVLVADRKRRQPMASAIMLELTRILPDHTWLSELQFRGDEVKVAGYSAAAADLIALIDGSEMFGEPRFRSPVTQDPLTARERFNLTFHVKRPTAGGTDK